MASFQRYIGREAALCGLPWVKSLSVFHLFPKLPKEVREMVWLETVDWEPAILPRLRMPELEACRESRDTLLKVYELCFHSTSSRQVTGIDALQIEKFACDIPLISLSRYANFATDVLYFSEPMLNDIHMNWETMENHQVLDSLLVPEALAKLKHLAIPYIERRFEHFFLGGLPDQTPMIGQFSGLTMLSLVIPFWYARDHEEVTEMDLGIPIPPERLGDLTLRIYNDNPSENDQSDEVFLVEMDHRYDADESCVGNVALEKVAVLKDDGRKETAFGSIEATIAHLNVWTNFLEDDWKMPKVQNARMYHYK